MGRNHSQKERARQDSNLQPSDSKSAGSTAQNHNFEPCSGEQESVAENATKACSCGCARCLLAGLNSAEKKARGRRLAYQLGWLAAHTRLGGCVRASATVAVSFAITNRHPEFAPWWDRGERDGELAWRKVVADSTMHAECELGADSNRAAMVGGAS